MDSQEASRSSANMPWHAAYPTVKTSPIPSISCAELLQWYRDGKNPGLDFVLVDLRRIDYEGGTIKGSINLPAQSLHPSIPTLYALFSNANISAVIWYCGSSRGRGTRAAGWFADYIKEQSDSMMQSMVLLGGIQAWVMGGQRYTELVEEYQADVWKK